MVDVLSSLLSSPYGHSSFLIMCLRGLIIVLFCRLHDLDVQCASLVQSNCSGAQKGVISLTPPSPLFATEIVSRQTECIEMIQKDV